MIIVISSGDSDGGKNDDKIDVNNTITNKNSRNKNIAKLSGSIRGVDIKQVKDLSVLDFAPGSKPIRLTIFSESAIKELDNLKKPAAQRIMEMMIQSR